MIAVRQNGPSLTTPAQLIEQADGGIWFGDIDIDLAAFRVTCNGGEVPMPIWYYRVLCFLAQQPGKTVSREEIMANTWRPEVKIRLRTVDARMHQLRKILESAGSRVHLKTVRFQGYMLVYDAAGELSQ